jgi:hypothetical protein
MISSFNDCPCTALQKGRTMSEEQEEAEELTSEDDAITCTDCGGELRPITIMDRGHMNAPAPGDLMYRMADDKRSFWTGRYPTAGPVKAYLCQDCGRIALYGQIDDSRDEEAGQA